MEGERLGNVPPCASCRYIKRRCENNCLMAPYFPHSRYEDYVNVHRLFGLSNIQRFMSLVEPNQRQTLANTLMTEGNMRSNDPVNGCLGLIQYLETQIEISQRELHHLNRTLSICQEMQLCKTQQLSVTDLIDLLDMQRKTSEAMDDPKTLENGHNNQSTLEGENVQQLGENVQQLGMDVYQNEQGVASNFGEPKKFSNVDSKARGKKPMECSTNEESEYEVESPKKDK